MDQTISEILSAQWLINNQTIVSYIPAFISYLNGNPLSTNKPQAIETYLNTKTPYVLSSVQEISLVDRCALANGNVPPFSVAIIPVQGPILSRDTMQIANYTKMAEANPNVIAIVYLSNTPGGMVFYTDIASEVITNCSKPTVNYVMGMLCSAGEWLLSGVDRTIVSSSLDRLGSIGVMTTITTVSSMLEEKLGIKIEDIYADDSEHKNFSFREYIKGNNQPIKDNLNFINKKFHSVISKNLGVASNSEVFKGGDYFAEEAIRLGLAHEIGSFESAIEYARELGFKNVSSNFNK